MPPDLTILAFDTSAAHCAAALLIGGRIVASRHEEMTKGQAERLFPMLDEVLTDAGAVWSDLDAIGIGVGPGNFTGIRIGVSAARGLALSLGIPAVGVSAFEALRGPEWFADLAPQIVSLPARRKGADVMLQVFENALAKGAPVEMSLSSDESNPRDRPTFPEDANVLGYDAAAVRRALYKETTGSTSSGFGPENPIADAVAYVAALKFPYDKTCPSPSPLYIRPADAAPASDPPPVILP